MAKPCQSKSSPRGGSEAPWARSSSAKHRKLAPQARGQGPEDGAAETGGVGEQQGRPLSAEVVVGDPHAVGRRHRSRWAGWAGGARRARAS